MNERLTGLALSLNEIKSDIVVLQEVFHHAQQQKLYQAVAKNYSHVAGFAKTGFSTRLDNELITLSRFPINDGKLVRFHSATAEELIFTSKGFYHSIINLPHIGQVHLINFHTTAGGGNAHPEHPRMEKIRSKQIKQMLSYVQGLDLVVFVGDLNAGPHTSVANYRQVLDAGFIDIFAKLGTEGLTWDPNNPLVSIGAEQHLPAQKIDHIFINEAISKLLVPIEAQIIFDQYCTSTCDGKIPLSDHYGVLANFTISTDINTQR